MSNNFRLLRSVDTELSMSKTDTYRTYQEKAAGPYHDFWLLKEAERDYQNYRDLLGRKDALVRVSDDLLRYFYDTLNWIPTLNPGRSLQQGYGLNLYGPTIINSLGGQQFANVAQAWASLMKLGPEELVLSIGSMGIVDEKGELEDKGWCRLEVMREDIVHKLNLLAEWGILASTGDFYILHLGI